MLNRFLLRRFSQIHRPQVALEWVILVSCVWFAAVCNSTFWHEAMTIHPGGKVFAVSVFIVLVSVHALLLALIVWRWNAKYVLAVLFLVTAIVVHFMEEFHIYMNPDMIRNVFHTDRKESRELISLQLLFPLIVYAGIPLCFLGWVRLRQRSALQAALLRLGFIGAIGCVCLIAVFVSSQDIAAMARNHRQIRYLATPINYVVSSARALKSDIPHVRQAKLPIEHDATVTSRLAGRPPRLLVIILGETARAQNWGLNGYSRQTTPRLAQRADVINFPDMHACGTSTEVSVPCLFSPYGRHHYDESAIAAHQSLLHVLEHAGIRTLWRDNQSGCKGVCDGLAFDHLDDAKDPSLCHDGRCVDEILLRDFSAQVRAKPGDRVVVLHQIGSHGPNYFERYPPAFARFTPLCQTGDLGTCTPQQIVNAFDNSMTYTDTVIAKTIEQLQAMQDYDTALIYFSDHGESLGEKGLYLHGMPYAIAPSEQTHIPMVMWFSNRFATHRGLDLACVRQRAQTRLDHDLVFPSVLNLMEVSTAVYDRHWDVFAECVHKVAPLPQP